MNSAGFIKFQYRVWRRHAAFHTHARTPLLDLREEENDTMPRTVAQKKWSRKSHLVTIWPSHLENKSWCKVSKGFKVLDKPEAHDWILALPITGVKKSLGFLDLTPWLSSQASGLIVQSRVVVMVKRDIRVAEWCRYELLRPELGCVKM